MADVTPQKHIEADPSFQEALSQLSPDQRVKFLESLREAKPAVPEADHRGVEISDARASLELQGISKKKVVNPAESLDLTSGGKSDTKPELEETSNNIESKKQLLTNMFNGDLPLNLKDYADTIYGSQEHKTP